jgi:D-galactarolactone cycloisomerase
VRSGFKTVKLKAGGKLFSEDLAHIQAFQEMTGQNTRLILDANQSYDQAAARKWETWFSAWGNVLWFEEPMPFDVPAEYRCCVQRFLFRLPEEKM